ncbi:hypothetical protein ACN47E_009932 [Coniothyrium glycines]
MSLRLHVRERRERPLQHQQIVRRLINTCEPPESPANQKFYCDTIETDGRRCQSVLTGENQAWCSWHTKDLNDVKSRWERVQRDADDIVVVDAHSAKQKVLKLRLAVDLRRRIRERFHARGVDTVDFIEWIASIEKDIQTLANTVLISSLNNKTVSAIPDLLSPQRNSISSDNIMILQSPLEPAIPIVSLQDILPDDGTILVLKHFSTDLCAHAIRRLYSIMPDLHFSGHRSDSPMLEDGMNDMGTDIVCSWFRIMILNESDVDALERATRSKSIAEFLAGCHASQLETYCGFFENAWRPHSVQYLRAAICAQTLAGGDIKTVSLLGGAIPSTSEGLKMRKPCWDILYHWFPTLLTPWTIASICSNFDDYTTLCKLLMLGFYHEHWFDASSVLNQSPTGVYFGFVLTHKGDFTLEIEPTRSGNLIRQHESRNYVCGQMAMGDHMTQAFLEELRRRTDRLYLVVYEGTSVDATVHPTEPDLFIKRTCSKLQEGPTSETEWSITMTLEDVKNTLRHRKTSMYDPIVVDSWQFIIIDRDAGMPFELIDIIEDTLLMLSGDPSPRRIAKRVISEVIPAPVQEMCFEETTIECPATLRFSPPAVTRYEGHRFRCHTPDWDRVNAQQKDRGSPRLVRDTNRFVRYVVDDMERAGIVSLVHDHEEPQTRPVVVQSSDGAMDLYFPYDQASPSAIAMELPLPAPTALLGFAETFKRKYPAAIMAKGSIQAHYCAWPMPIIKSMGNIGLNFATEEGHVYRWNAMPFDRPWSASAWQYYIQHCINSRYPFVMFYLTTFVICAVDREDAEDKATIILEEAEDRGWRINMPRISEWTSSIDDLHLETLFEGVRPA